MEGVKAVAEEIVVKYPGDLMKNDTEIALAILNALQWYSGVQDEKINIKVEDGIVSLEGEVEWEFQKTVPFPKSKT